MSYSIKTDSLFLNGANEQANTPVSSVKESNLHISGTREKEENNATDTILNISKEARLKLQNRPRAEGLVKKAGITSAREEFENFALEIRNDKRRGGGCGYPGGDLLEQWMRLDEPESYAKMKALENQRDEQSREEISKSISEVNTIIDDWFERRCLDEDGWLKNPVTGQRSVLSDLEARYSNAIHDTSVDVYDDSFSEQDASVWRFNTKFNVLMSIEMLKDLEMLNHMEQLSKEEQHKVREKMEKVDTAVNSMKEAELNYEGNLECLRFGVKFDQKGDATYYANYARCEDKNGISAESAEELLEKLMSK